MVQAFLWVYQLLTHSWKRFHGLPNRQKGNERLLPHTTWKISVKQTLKSCFGLEQARMNPGGMPDSTPAMIFGCTQAHKRIRSNISQAVFQFFIGLCTGYTDLHCRSQRQGCTKAHFATFLGWRRIDDQSCVTNSIDQTQRPASRDMGRQRTSVLHYFSKCHKLCHGLPTCPLNMLNIPEYGLESDGKLICKMS